MATKASPSVRLLTRAFDRAAGHFSRDTNEEVVHKRGSLAPKGDCKFLYPQREKKCREFQVTGRSDQSKEIKIVPS